MNEDEMKALITRVTAEVVSEVKKVEAERGIGVSELRDHAKELGGGKLDTAWKISYDTSSKLSDAADVAAWKISYDTSGKVAGIADNVTNKR